MNMNCYLVCDYKVHAEINEPVPIMVFIEKELAEDYQKENYPVGDVFELPFDLRAKPKLLPNNFLLQGIKL